MILELFSTVLGRDAEPHTRLYLVPVEELI